MNKSIQEMLCAAYGVTRSVVVDATKSAYAGVKTNADTTLATVVELQEIVGDVLTEMYRCIYYEEECDFLMNSLTEEEKRNFGPNEFKQLDEMNRVVIKFPRIPDETPEGLLSMFLLKVIDWPMYLEYRRRMANIPVGETATQKNPWKKDDEEFLLSILGSKSKKKQDQQGGGSAKKPKTSSSK
jgi:hypothetical protein